MGSERRSGQAADAATACSVAAAAASENEEEARDDHGTVDGGCRPTPSPAPAPAARRARRAAIRERSITGVEGGCPPETLGS